MTATPRIRCEGSNQPAHARLNARGGTSPVGMCKMCGQSLPLNFAGDMAIHTRLDILNEGQGGLRVVEPSIPRSRISALFDQAAREPINVDLSDYSDEYCEGFLDGQVNALEALGNET